jgi:hypothetical protein
VKSPPSIKQDPLAGLRGGAFWFNQPVEVAPDYAFHGHHIIEIAGNAKGAILAGNTISNSAILVQEDASTEASWLDRFAALFPPFRTIPGEMCDEAVNPQGCRNGCDYWRAA